MPQKEQNELLLWREQVTLYLIFPGAVMLQSTASVMLF